MRRLSIGLALYPMFVVTAAANAADLATFLPRETDLVLSLNVRQVLEAPAIKTRAIDLIRTTLNTSKEAQESVKALGLDPLADFHRVSIGMELENLNNPRAIIVIEGKFDPARIARLMEDLIKKDPKQFGTEKVGGKALYKLTPAKQQIPVYAATIDTNVIVVGTVKEYVANAVDAAKGVRKPEIRKELSDLLAKTDARASLWLAAHTKGRLTSVPLPDADLKKMIEQVESISGEVRIDKDLQATFTLSTSSADVAKQVQSLAESAIGLYRLQLKLALADQPELKPLVDLASSIKAVQKDKQIVVTGNLDGASIEKLLKAEKK